MRMIAACLVVAALAFSPATVRADDDPCLLDGGSLVTSTDGGRDAFAALQVRSDWVMSIRCEGAQSTRYALTADGGLASSTSPLLDYDKTTDIPVNRIGALSRGYPTKTGIALRTDDAGIPNCFVNINH